MTVSINTAPISPLRQRMQHDMMMRGLGSHTQKDYVRHVKRLAAFLGRPPDTATEEDLRRFQLMQHESGVRPTTINGTVSALRFLYTVTLKRRDLSRALVITRIVPRLPEVLSVEEAARLLQAAPVSSIRQRWAWPMARACACRKSPTSRSMISTASEC